MPNVIKSYRAQSAGSCTIPLRPQVVDKEQITQPAADAAQEQLQMARAEADQMLREAELKAADIIEKARLDAGQLQEKAVQEVLDEAHAQRDVLLEEARMVLESAQAVRVEMIRMAEPQVVELSVKIAENLVNACLALDPGLIKDTVAKAIALLAGEERILVKVNPLDLAVCREHKSYFQENLTDDAQIKILPDESVGRGSCVVQGQYSLVESYLDERFNVLRETLLEEAKNGATSSD